VVTLGAFYKRLVSLVCESKGNSDHDTILVSCGYFVKGML
jgi:hypothetical protein